MISVTSDINNKKLKSLKQGVWRWINCWNSPIFLHVKNQTEFIVQVIKIKFSYEKVYKNKVSAGLFQNMAVKG